VEKQNYARSTIPEEAGDSTCSKGVKFQEGLWPDQDASDQLYPQQEVHVEC
jgi:hypothetical protein